MANTFSNLPAQYYIVDSVPNLPTGVQAGSIATVKTTGAIYCFDGTSWVLAGSVGGVVAIGGTITGGTAGSVLFVNPSGVIAQDNTNFFWDDAGNNLRLGAGPTNVNFDVYGDQIPQTTAIVQTFQAGGFYIKDGSTYQGVLVQKRVVGGWTSFSVIASSAVQNDSTAPSDPFSIDWTWADSQAPNLSYFLIVIKNSVFYEYRTTGITPTGFTSNGGEGGWFFTPPAFTGSINSATYPTQPLPTYYYLSEIKFWGDVEIQNDLVVSGTMDVGTIAADYLDLDFDAQIDGNLTVDGSSRLVGNITIGTAFGNSSIQSATLFNLISNDGANNMTIGDGSNVPGMTINAINNVSINTINGFISIGAGLYIEDDSGNNQPLEMDDDTENKAFKVKYDSGSDTWRMFTDYYDAGPDSSLSLGMLGYTDFFKIMGATGSLKAGVANASAITSSGTGSIAMGNAEGGSTLEASSSGSFASGKADGGDIISSNNGSFAIGKSGGGGTIEASGEGSFSGGNVDQGQITSSSSGSFAFGQVDNSGSEINASQSGAFASGRAQSSGKIEANGEGTFAIGHADGTNSRITANDRGAMAFGNSESGGRILANNGGAISMGHTEGANSKITADGQGNIALGRAADGGFLNAEDDGGSAIIGFADGAGALIHAHIGIVLGWASAGETTSATGEKSVTIGRNVQNTADNAFAIGSSFTQSDNDSFKVGFGQVGLHIDATDSNLISGIGNASISAWNNINITAGGSGSGDTYIGNNTIFTAGGASFAGLASIDSGGNVSTQKLTVGTHVIGSGGTPTTAAGTGAGTSPTISILGTDIAGEISVTTGTLPTGTNATIVTVTFSSVFAAAPYMVLYPANAVTATLSGVSMVFVTGTTTTFLIKSGTTALTAATAYKWNYHTIG